MPQQLTESRPTSGEGRAACKVCTWVLVQESATKITERCTSCGQQRSRDRQLNEGGSQKKLLLERTAGLFLLMLLAGCVTGPVTAEQSAKYNTRSFVNMGEQEGAIVASIATRNILDNYSSKMANIWVVWEKGKKDIMSIPPLPNMTQAQIQIHTQTVADELLKAAIVRDNQLSTLDRNRATELEQVNRAHSNQLKVMEGIVEAWRTQGEISSEQWRMWLSVAQKGAAVYLEQAHIADVRREAKKAAERQAEEAKAAAAAAGTE